MSTTHITIRIDKKIKEELDMLSKITGMNLSSFVRDVVVKIASIRGTVEALRTIEKVERALIKAITQLPELQELLRELTKYLRTRELPIGYFDERIEEYRVLLYDYSVRCENDRCYPVKVEKLRDCNEYGSCWYVGYNLTEIETIKEFVEFLDEAVQSVTEELEGKIESIKEAIKELLK